MFVISVSNIILMLLAVSWRTCVPREQLSCGQLKGSTELSSAYCIISLSLCRITKQALVESWNYSGKSRFEKGKASACRGKS